VLDYKIHPWRNELEVEEKTEGGEKFVVLSDPMGIAAQAIQMPAQLWESLQFLNIENINERIAAGEFTFELDMEQVRTVIYNLDIMGFLDSPRTQVLGSEIKGYLSSPTRPAICSGSVYPEEPEKLKKRIGQILELSEYDGIGKSKPRVVFAPHLDYNTGLATLKVYAEAFKPLAGHKYKRVIMLGTSHYADSNLLMLTEKDYETPLGKAKCNNELTQKFLANPHVSVDDIAHKNEHSIELHLPYLQYILEGDVEYVFGLTGIINDEPQDKKKIEGIIELLKSVIDEDTLLVCSGDLTHIGKKFGDSQSSLDMREGNIVFIEKTLDTLRTADAKGFFDWVNPRNPVYKVCGLTPFFLGLKLAGSAVVLNEGAYVVWEEEDTESSVSITSFVYT
jgi:AmmeMemoRadiSam system protein B